MVAHFDLEAEIFDHPSDFWSRLDHGFFATTLPFSHT